MVDRRIKIFWFEMLCCGSGDAYGRVAAVTRCALSTWLDSCVYVNESNTLAECCVCVALPCRSLLTSLEWLGRCERDGNTRRAQTHNIERCESRHVRCINVFFHRSLSRFVSLVEPFNHRLQIMNIVGCCLEVYCVVLFDAVLCATYCPMMTDWRVDRLTNRIFS